MPDGVLLRNVPAFVPKVASNSNVNREAFLPAFYPLPSNKAEKNLHILDVKRAVEMCISMPAIYRQSENLFLPFKASNIIKNDPRHAVRAHSIISAYTPWPELVQVPIKTFAMQLQGLPCLNLLIITNSTLKL